MENWKSLRSYLFVFLGDFACFFSMFSYMVLCYVVFLELCGALGWFPGLLRRVDQIQRPGWAQLVDGEDPKAVSLLEQTSGPSGAKYFSQKKASRLPVSADAWGFDPFLWQMTFLRFWGSWGITRAQHATRPYAWVAQKLLVTVWSWFQQRDFWLIKVETIRNREGTYDFLDHFFNIFYGSPKWIWKYVSLLSLFPADTSISNKKTCNPPTPTPIETTSFCYSYTRTSHPKNTEAFGDFDHRRVHITKYKTLPTKTRP